MKQREPMNIRLVVDDEQTLYSPFSPEAEFNEPVQKYLRGKLAGMDYHQSISLTVISREPINEDRFRSAVSDWINDEKAMFRKNEKDNLHLLIALLVFGSILITLSVALEKRFEILQYTLFPIMGTLALSKAAGKLLIDMPISVAKKRILDQLEKNNIITFVCDQELSTSHREN
jgi:hypothetical protein